MKVRGKSLMIRVDGRTIALATDCTFEATLNTLDARTKADVGTNEVADGYTWSIACNSLLGINPGTEQHTYATLMRLFRTGMRVTVEVFLAAGADGSVPVGDWQPGASSSRGFAPHIGEALIKSVSIKGGVNDNASISIQLGGQGELDETEQILTSRVEGSTLIVEGPASVERGEILIDGELNITDNTIEL